MWTRFLLCPAALGILLVAQPTASEAQDIMDRQALLEHGFEIASFQPPDPFSGPQNESGLAGTVFRFSQPLRESDAPNLTHIIGGWSYDLSKQNLRVAVSTAGWRQTQLPNAEADDFMEYGLRVGTRNLSDDNVSAQNAYGAQFDVQSMNSQSVHIAPLTRSERAASVAILDEMYVDLRLAPEAARQAVENAQIIAEGTLVADPKGRVTQCYDTASQATINRRLATLIRTCVMNARIDRVAIVSGQGEVLAEWLPADH